MKYKILVIDDEEAARYGIRKALQVKEHVILEAADLASARFLVEREEPALVLLDVNLPDGSGIGFLKELSARRKPPTVIVVTAHGSERIAIEAIRAGAYEYLSKPFEVDELRLLVKNARERDGLSEENRILKEELGRDWRFGTMVGQGAAMKPVFEIVERVAATDVTVLILGDSGTGKELVAREIHRRSSRSSMPFVALNCAALPDSLIESELFGHEKGAFTGAIARRQGKFELADGGTLFLDEIGDMVLGTQAKVLRVLEDRRFERLGSSESLSVDVRIICATHRDLGRAIAQSEFREDLYYRIRVVTIEIPALRERREDIELLLEYFGKNFAEKYRIQWSGFTEAALRTVESAMRWRPSTWGTCLPRFRRVVLRAGAERNLPSCPTKRPGPRLNESTWSTYWTVTPETSARQRRRSGFTGRRSSTNSSNWGFEKPGPTGESEVSNPDLATEARRHRD